MRYSKLMLVALGALGMQVAGATPTPEEAAQLGKTLTPLGAIKAGNKEGTIPEWTGGVCTPPAGYKPLHKNDGGPYVDPFAADKPLFKITAENMVQYKDKLDLGTQELFRRYPKTWYMNVYPTRRSACFRQYVYDNTIKNVMKPKLVGAPNWSLVDAHAQYPFPIPKTGAEVMWNMQLQNIVQDQVSANQTWLVDSAGNAQQLSAFHQDESAPYWDNSIPYSDAFYKLRSYQDIPVSAAGSQLVLHFYLRPDKVGQPVWQYIPGQRRVRMAPEFGYDGVAPSASGIMLFDEGGGWLGKLDRFDFKLIGRQETYISDNTSPDINSSEKILTPNHLDPAAMRWELHRTWVVQADLRPGERHVQKKKWFWIDEDSWVLNAYVGIDQAGKPDKYFLNNQFQFYEKPIHGMQAQTAYSFTKGAYAFWNFTGAMGGYAPTISGNYKPKYPFTALTFTPEGMQGSGVR